MANIFTPLEIMLRCSEVERGVIVIRDGFNAPLEFLTGFAFLVAMDSVGMASYCHFVSNTIHQCPDSKASKE